MLFWHWYTDFVLQTDKQAKGKSSNWNDLLNHTASYSLIWIIPCLFLFNTVMSGVLFIATTFIFHTVTDYFTSRLNKKLWEKGDVHNFFISIGFDQFLHYLQLFLTYLWLI